MRTVRLFDPLVTSHGIIVDEIQQGVWQWWKALVLGSAVGGLLAVACIPAYMCGKTLRYTDDERIKFDRNQL